MTTLAINSALASPKAFISFSMPQKAIEAIASDASRLGIALFLNGLIEDLNGFIEDLNGLIEILNDPHGSPLKPRKPNPL